MEIEFYSQPLHNEKLHYSNVLFSRFGTYSTSEALNAGLDLEMPGPPRWRTPLLLNHSLTSQKLTLNTIDERAGTVLK